MRTVKRSEDKADNISQDISTKMTKTTANCLEYLTKFEIELGRSKIKLTDNSQRRNRKELEGKNKKKID